MGTIPRFNIACHLLGSLVVVVVVVGSLVVGSFVHV